MELDFDRVSLEIYLLLGILKEGAMVVQQEPLAQPCDHVSKYGLYSITCNHFLLGFCTSIEDLP
jgi:hypothetical protein